MSYTNPEIKIQSDPNGVLFGSYQDIFFRQGESLYFINASDGKILPLSLPMKLFIGKYGTPMYKGWPLMWKYPSEMWIKGSGKRSRNGWSFVVGKDPISGPEKIVAPSITPTPTPSSTPTPTPTPLPTPYYFAMIPPPGGEEFFGGD